VIRDTLQPKEVNPLSTTTELAQLHDLIGGLRRCVTSLASRYGDTPAMRRIVNDAERILNDIDRLDIDAEELDLARGTSHHHHVGEKIAIPDTQYASDFWQGVDDEGLGGQR
jgi:nitrogen-specific signal transduction histidine kinase